MTNQFLKLGRLGAVLIVAGLLSTASAAQLRTQTIALSGQPAPDGNGVFSAFGIPMLNDAGQVGFWARLSGTSGGVRNPDNEGLLRGEGGPVTQIARTYLGRSYYSPTMNEAGQVAFEGWLGRDQNNNNIWGILRGDGQTLTEIGRTLGINGLLDNGQVAVVGCIDQASQTCGILLGDGQSFTQVIQQGQAAPDGDGTFGLVTVAFPAFNRSGQFAFQVDLLGATAGASRIYRKDGPALTEIARTGQRAPDGDGVFADFYPGLAFNNLGQVAFIVDLMGASSGHTRIYRSDGSSLTEIARTGQPAPDGNGTLTNLKSTRSGGALALNDLGQVVFMAELPGTLPNAGAHHGVFLGDGTKLIQLVRTGQTAPDDDNTIFGFTPPVLNDVGQLAFELQSLTDAPGFLQITHIGVYLYDGAELVPILHPGDLVNVGGGDIRAIAHNDHRGSSGLGSAELNNRGQLAFDLRFTDGTSGVFLVTVVPETSPPALLGARVSGDNFEFTVTGQAGVTYGLQASEDLKVWSDVPAVSIRGPSGQVRVPASGNARFFRAIVK